MEKLINGIVAIPQTLFGLNEPISKWGYRWLCFFLLASFLLLWQFTFPAIIPKFDAIWEEFLILLLQGGLLYDVGVTLKLVMRAMFFSVLIAFVISYLGAVTNFFKPIAAVFEKFRFWSLYGFTPVIRILTADGDMLRLGILMFGLIPFMVNSFNKVLYNIKEDPLYDCAYTLGLSELQAAYYVVFRSRLPQVIIAICANFAIAWALAPAAETASYDGGGIGMRLYMVARHVPGAGTTDNLYGAAFALQFVILILGITFDYLFNKSRKALPEERVESKNDKS